MEIASQPGRTKMVFNNKNFYWEEGFFLCKRTKSGFFKTIVMSHSMLDTGHKPNTLILKIEIPWHRFMPHGGQGATLGSDLTKIHSFY